MRDTDTETTSGDVGDASEAGSSSVSVSSSDIVPSVLDLKASFGPQQDATLNDYIQISLMLQYNNR